MSKLIQDENEDDETTFYPAAFQCFDWNHSGRISTSLSCQFKQNKEYWWKRLHTAVSSDGEGAGLIILSDIP